MIREFIDNMVHDKHSIIQQLLTVRGGPRAAVPPARLVSVFVDSLLDVLFPHFSPKEANSPATLEELVNTSTQILSDLCAPVLLDREAVIALQDAFMSELPNFCVTLQEDAQAIYRGDPAAASIDEVLVAYPGFLAITVYRVAHWLSDQKVPIVPRMMSEYAHRLTGIDIHPGAVIGRSFVIDHGTGVVIGQTTVIHDNVKIYQGVTLGALSVDKSAADTKRHPTIERDVVIYANATILGGTTTIGAGSIIGGNVWLVSSVAPNSRVYHRSEVTVRSSET
jgi:serine O-acetyltransferase